MKMYWELKNLGSDKLHLLSVLKIVFFNWRKGDPGAVYRAATQASNIWRSSNTSPENSSQHATLDAWHEGSLKASRLQFPALPAGTTRKCCPRTSKGSV